MNRKLARTADSAHRYRAPMLLASSLVLAGATLFALPAGAFARRTTCGTTAKADASCVPLSWPLRCVTYNVDARASDVFVDAALVERAARNAIASWSSVVCRSGKAPSLALRYGAVVARRGDVMTSGENTISFAVDDWPYAGPEGEIARTFLAFDRTGGQIWASNITLNAFAHDFGPEGVPPSIHDLETTILHELGHVLGLAHSADAASVMAPSLGAGERRRTLTQDDIDGLCDAYPPGAPVRCDAPSPSSTASDSNPPSSGGCAASGNTLPVGGAWASLGLCLGVLRILRRRRAPTPHGHR